MNNPPHGPSGFDRERDALDEQHRQRALLQQEELAQREREHNERQERERQHREQYQAAPPHQNNAGSIPIHQPVASRLPGAIHSPGGLLANHGGAPPAGPLGAPSGPGNAFGGPLHAEASRSIQHNPQNPSNQLQQQQSFGPNILHHNNPASIGAPGGAGVPFSGPIQQQQQQQQPPPAQDAVRLQQLSFGAPIPQGPQGPQGHQMPGAPALGQGGQQPILNDALSYLDQVKVQFADQPDVYNRFLDIMKDFKSQAIDTPGVINRVSELFAGHPNLIQGFNTFLPPGYRIECGAGNDPNTIRVTTPMGTTVQSITGVGRALPDTINQGAGGNGGYYGSQRPGGWQQQPQHGIESPETVFSPQNQNAGPPYGQNQSQHPAYEAQAQAQQAAAAAAHHQQQRGVSQLTNAVATLGQPPRNTQTPTPGGGPGVNGAAGQQPGLEKRGPVEFNHAISYVNKIKNRFQDKPEIYKQFLEILQTYQRESKPIQDVYQQVTLLFFDAPDLLEDFKQFLPESAAQAKAAAAKAAEEAAMSNQTPQAKLPPVGNFALPASSSKESKKRPRNVPAPSGSQIPAADGHRGIAGTISKRVRLSNKPTAADAPDVSPTLTPVFPEPMLPGSTLNTTSEEMAFFDRVKKYLQNKTSMSEFLKLCNMFSQDLIDRDTLVYRAGNFINGNADLSVWFKDFVEYTGTDTIINNKPAPPTERVSLSNCRSLGPSYRHLPKRERLKPCSGRDEMCHAVLNDDWASHPTWASEDSGFVAHRKNTFEESLHRIEEERHDYDLHIEANSKVIQLLEPIGQSLLAADPADRENFRVPLGLGGSSQSIYMRSFKKIYGERGPEVVADLFKDPGAVLPIVMTRLRQKDEEWRFSQREWEKVWSAHMLSIYLKSLDHQGIQVKAADKKNFGAKHLVDAIKTKSEEQKRLRSSKQITPRWQFEFDFSDQGVILDLLRIMVLYANNAPQHNSHERRRISDFLEKFIPIFFDLSEAKVIELTGDIDRGTPDEDSEDVTPTELPNGRGRRPANGKKGDLRRGVLDKGRNGTRGRTQKEESASGSKESTPDVDSAMEDEPEDHNIMEITNERWTSTPAAFAMKGTKPLDPSEINLDTDQQEKRDWYRLHCNQHIYVFFSVFQTLYRRLKEVKESKEAARQEGIRECLPKPAKDIGLLVEPEGVPVNHNEPYYPQALKVVEQFIAGDLSQSHYEDFLRRYYLQRGWQLYTIMDLLKIISKIGTICSSLDNKEKTPDLIELFYRNRENPETSFNAEINARKQAEKFIKDGETFLIVYRPTSFIATVQWLQKDDTTFNLSDQDRKHRWQYYTSSYVRVEPTEGVTRRDFDNQYPSPKAVLTRNTRLGGAEFTSHDGSSKPPKPFSFDENLTLRICVNSYKIIYDSPGSESFIWTEQPLTFDEKTGNAAARDRLRKVEDRRSRRFLEKFVMNNEWMKGLPHDKVSKVNADFKTWMEDGTVPDSETSATLAPEDDDLID